MGGKSPQDFSEVSERVDVKVLAVGRHAEQNDRRRATMVRCLHAAGWSVGDVAFVGPSGLVWIASGVNGEKLIRGGGPDARRRLTS